MLSIDCLMHSIMPWSRMVLLSITSADSTTPPTRASPTSTKISYTFPRRSGARARASL